MAENPPVRNSAWITYVAVEDMNTPGSFKANPTISSGDFKVSKDDGALANLATLPSVSPAGSIWIKLELSATEMDADNVKIQWIDQTSPKEWSDSALTVITTAS